jgi:hypothetical protein
MTHKRFHRRPEVESLETMVLLSGGSAVEHPSVPAMIELHAQAGNAILLTGTAKGTYKSSSSGVTTFSDKGTLSPLGKVTLKGSINYRAASPTGMVTFSSATKKHGKITASLSTQGPNQPVFFMIESSNGIYSGDTGSGEALLSVVRANGKGPQHGKVTITFVQVSV